MELQTRIFVPWNTTYPDEFWMPTILGRIIRPIITNSPPLNWWWFSSYVCPLAMDSSDCNPAEVNEQYIRNDILRSMKFRFSVADENRELIENTIREYVLQDGCMITDIRNYSSLEDLGGTRYINISANGDLRAERRNILLRLLNATCDLTLHALIGPNTNGEYSFEIINDPGVPLQSAFAIPHHLFCNITQVPLRVLVSPISILTDFQRNPVNATPVRVQF